MTEITRVQLENEMDLILAHKQAMRLAELCGLGLSMQTTLATAVSELGRAALDSASTAMMLLYVSDKGETPKLITVCMRFENGTEFSEEIEGFRHAKRLVRNVRVIHEGRHTSAELHYGIPAGTRIDAGVTDEWRRQINASPNVSPYEEIKRKNRQLQEFADKLRDSEQLYKELTDSLPLIIFTIDAQGNALFGNKWLAEYSGLSLDEINTTKWKTLFHEENYPAVLENISKLASGNYKRDMEYRLRQNGSGDYKWHMGTITPVQTAEGETSYWSVFMVDIHAQKEAEAMLQDNRELRETKALLEEKIAALNISNVQLEQFAYVASHDLQEPLRKIIHFSDYLSKRYANVLPDDSRNVLARISSATAHMQTLIADVLSYSVLPDANTKWELVSLNIILREVLAEQEWAISEKKGTVNVDWLPSVEGNTIQLRQLVENLLSNSLKYSEPERPLRITIAGEKVGGELLIRFRDNGIGFESQYVSKIFELFQRLHGRDKYSGTGIGLAICRKIVELHHGSIQAESEVGKGTTMTVRLPLAQEKKLEHRVPA